MIRTSDHSGNLQLAINQALLENDDVVIDGPLQTARDTIKIESFNQGYKQVSLTIHGTANYWDTGKRSVQKFSFSDKPFIGIQKGKGVRIIGMNLTGPAEGNVTGLDTRNDLNSAISIDYVDPRKVGDNSRGGSTGCLIDNCTFQNCIAGISVSVNGYTQNGESMTFQNLRFINCKYGVVSCQAQEKQNVIYNVGCWTPMDTFFMCNSYGEGSPGHYEINRTNFKDVKRILYRKTAGWLPLHMKNVFAESLYEFGHWATAKSDSIIDSDINFLYPSISGFPDAHLTGGGVRFEDTQLRYMGHPSIPLLLAAKDNVYIRSQQPGYAKPVVGWYDEQTEQIGRFPYSTTFTHPRLKAGDYVFFSNPPNYGLQGMAEYTGTGFQYTSPSIEAGKIYNIGKYVNN